MATPKEKLAASLEVLHTLQQAGRTVIRSSDLTRTHRERLVQNGFLQEVIRGWYIPARPDEAAGESTAWYASFWQFCASYLDYRFSKDWCLSPEQSLLLHTENWTVPHQLLIRSSKGQNNVTLLPEETSLLDVRTSLPNVNDLTEKEGLRLFSLPAALIACAPDHFKQNPTDMRAALSMIKDASEILAPLLEGGHATIAGRLVGGFRNIGRQDIADQILSAMRAAGYDVREQDPFAAPTAVTLRLREQSPYVNRLRLLWDEMREPIIERFPKSPGLLKDAGQYLQHVKEIYVTDAYHSLSIEGYHVSAELIERVRRGQWNPNDKSDRKHLNALAARGYWQAYQAVLKSIEKVINKKNPGMIVGTDHRVWYQEMFEPSVVAGILKPTDLAGYRSNRVHIRGSMHTPPSCDAVRDAMPAFFDLLSEEKEPSVRVVLGHFIFVYIHPYMDGNGRVGRFLMNVMLAAGGYPWTIIPVEQRDIYMAALEEASVRQNIAPFADFLACLIESPAY